MIVKKLREAMEEVADVMAAAGARTQVKALRAFVNIFKGQDDQPVTEFLADLHRRLHPAPSVDAYVDRLLAAGNDKKEFDAIFNEVKKDKSIRKDEANTIARKYTEG